MLASVLHWTGDFDWTAAGTLALAFGTAWLGWQTRAAARAAATEVAASQRPIVVPVLWRFSTLEWSQTESSYHRLYLDVKSIGSGPALDVSARVISPETKNRSVTALESVAVGPGDTSSIELNTADLAEIVQLESIVSLIVELTYQDAAGMNWHTFAQTSAASDATLDEIAKVGFDWTRPGHGKPHNGRGDNW